MIGTRTAWEGASGFVAVCGAIGAGIAAANAITNAVASFKAANATCNGGSDMGEKIQ